MGMEADRIRAAGEAAEVRKSARDRIFDTARELFYERGIRAVGVETIAAEAGATKMTLYRNFPSKDELVAECLREQSRDGLAWWDEVIAPYEGDPRRQLEALFTGFADKTCEESHGCALSNAALELHEPDHPARLVAIEHKREMHRRLKEMSAAAGAKDNGLADALMMLLEGGHVARVTLEESGPVRALETTAKALIRAFLDH